MKNKIPALLVIFALLSGGCATTVPREQLITQADAIGYGEAPGTGWEDKVKAFMEFRLKDPLSAQYKFGVPEKGWITKPPISGGGIDLVGYQVGVAINAKNSYGGYTGFKEHRFLFRDNKIVAYIDLSTGMGFWQKL